MTQLRPWISDEGHELMHKLAQGLVMKVPDENFDMGGFGYAYSLSAVEAFACGTAACAMGHAAWMLAPHITRRSMGQWYVRGKFVGAGFTAAEELFGISADAALTLFDGDRPSDRHLIAESLIRFADTGELPDPGR